MRRMSLFASFFLLVTLVLGCSNGPPMGDVSGTVNVDGAPAPEGYITYTPTDNKKSPQGTEIKGGKYALRVEVGTAKIAIRMQKKVGEKKLYNTPDSPVAPIFDEILPDKYHDKTELTFDVKAGSNEKNWEVTSKEKEKAKK